MTVSTFLTRLVEKGVLTVERRGRSNFYTPAVTEQGYHKLEPLKKEELDTLRRWFEQEANHAD